MDAHIRHLNRIVADLGKQKADKEDNSRKKKRKKKEATRGSASI